MDSIKKRIFLIQNYICKRFKKRERIFPRVARYLSSIKTLDPCKERLPVRGNRYAESRKSGMVEIEGRRAKEGSGETGRTRG